MSNTKRLAVAAAVAMSGFVHVAHADNYMGVDLNPFNLAVVGGYANPNPLGGWANVQYVGDEETQNGHIPRAIVWSADGRTATDIGPAGWASSHALATNGTRQVGYGVNTGTNSHALYWVNLSATDIHPSALLPNGSSQAVAISASGAHQVGYGLGFGASANLAHAILWAGSAASAIDLNPSNYSSSWAVATTDNQQVGRGNGSPTNFQNHALVWSGSAASAVDLHPTALSPNGGSEALGTDGTHQVGDVTGINGNSNGHAYLWTGTIASGVDLHPAGYTYSQANAVLGNLEVGRGYGASTSNQFHALLWSGSAGSVIDLQALLPSNFQSSYATSIDANGDVFGFAFDPNWGTRAVEWVAPAGATAPEPASLSLLGLAVVGLASRRRR